MDSDSTMTPIEDESSGTMPKTRVIASTALPPDLVQTLQNISATQAQQQQMIKLSLLRRHSLYDFPAPQQTLQPSSYVLTFPFGSSWLWATWLPKPPTPPMTLLGYDQLDNSATAPNPIPTRTFTNRRSNSSSSARGRLTQFKGRQIYVTRAGKSYDTSKARSYNCFHYGEHHWALFCQQNPNPAGRSGPTL